jgi:hypothetical protein
LAALAAAQGAGGANGSNKADVEAVRAAVLDYVEGVYNVAPDRITRSVSPELNKYGHYSENGKSHWPTMSYTQLVDLSRRYNANGRVPANAPKEIQVLDVEHHIANAKLTAHWGVDYLLLAKGADGRWQIRQVMWEAAPPKPAAK